MQGDEITINRRTPMGWLSKEIVREDATAKVAELEGKIDNRLKTASLTYEHELIARNAARSIADGHALRKEWFFSSLGIEWDADDRETWYLCRSPISTSFMPEYVVHWTHWIGGLQVRLKEAAQSGSYPDQLEYGPPNRTAMLRHVGPLVNYLFDSGELTLFDFRTATDYYDETMVPAAAPSTITQLPEPVSQEARFGLKDIVELRDITQDDQIRGRMAGIYIITGGPGVGKTSVALHRIPYLILQQKEQLPLEGFPDLSTGPFFSVETIQVLVWKEHLVRYLKSCLADLHYGDIAVNHIDDWVASRLRHYIRIGKAAGDYQIREEPAEYTKIKLGMTDSNGKWDGFTEIHLEQFLTGRDASGQPLNPMAREATERLETLLTGLEELVADGPAEVHFHYLSSDFVFTVSGIQQAVTSLRSDLDGADAEARNALSNRQLRAADRPLYEKMRQRITAARERISNYRTAELDRLGAGYPRMLSDFYASPRCFQLVRDRFGLDTARRFRGHIERRSTQKRLSLADRYLVLWLIHLMTRGSQAEKANVRSLPLYSHTIIDEAQYYHPLMLRLLVQLAQPPLCSMTIVGDLEQKVTRETGLLSWKEIGLTTEMKKVFRLETNYRWSRHVYQFLDLFRQRAGLQVVLKAPRNSPSGDGIPPEIVTCANLDAELSWVVQRVTDLRRSDASMAIVLPPDSSDSDYEQVIAELGFCDVRARKAFGEDVHACVEQVILTNYDSIVGLEFDAVFIFRCSKVLPASNLENDNRQAVWVALTRAKKFLGISSVEIPLIFDAPEFDSYRVVQS
jgi:hypothetical protein